MRKVISTDLPLGQCNIFAYRLVEDLEFVKAFHAKTKNDKITINRWIESAIRIHNSIEKFIGKIE